MNEILSLSQIKEYSEKTAKELVDVVAKLGLKKKTVKGDGEFQVIATTSGIDRDGEIIKIEAWDVENFMKNPVVLFGHDYWSLPIGAVTKLEVKDGQIIASGVFANSEEAQKCRQLYDDGFLKAVSVGFIVKERDPANPYIITKAELLELSFVPVPANPDALSLSKMSKVINFFKAAVPAKDTTMQDPATEWEPGKALENVKTLCMTKDADGNEVMDFEKFKEAFAWFDADKPEDLGSYKLLHHDVEGSELVVNLQGVTSAMATLLSEESGIPEEDKKGVYDHLAAHYKQFEKEPPELKNYTAYELDLMFKTNEVAPEAIKLLDTFFSSVKALYTATKAEIKALGVEGTERKEGRVLSAKNRAAIVNAIQNLQEVLDLAEPEKQAIADSLKGVKELLQSMDKLGEQAIIEVKKALG